MSEQSSKRYYASTEYLLPADEAETRRLNRQHAVIVKAFDDRLSIAPITFKTGDRVLESAAGSGIWALDFFESNRKNGVTVDMECIDISSKQFPATHPPEMHFSVNSVLNLPAEWTNKFTYVHQRLVIAAMNDSRWHTAVSELLRVVQPGGWVELLELEVETLRWGVGPNSEKVGTIIKTLDADHGVIGDLSVYLPPLLKEAGFVDVQCVTRHVPIGGEEVSEGEIDGKKTGYRSEEWRDLWMAMKGPLMEGGGYGFVKTGDEYQELLQRAALEWKTSKEANTSFYTILARKPLDM